MRQQPKTRAEKIQLIKDMLKGKASAKDVIEPIYGVVFMHGEAGDEESKVFGYQTLTEKVFFEEGKEISLKEFEAMGIPITSTVQFVDFSKDK